MKSLLIIGLFIMAILPAYVLDANAQELIIKATPAEADLIWKGLRELPVKDVEALMGKIRQQVAEQTQPKPELKKDK
jgi:hypothetical protein